MAQNNAETNPFEDMLADKESDLDDNAGKEEIAGEDEETIPEKTEVIQPLPHKATKSKSSNKKHTSDRGPPTKTLESQILALTQKVNHLEDLIKSYPQSAGNATATREGQVPPQLPEIDDLLEWIYQLKPEQVPASAKGLANWMMQHNRPWMMPGALALIKAYVKQKQSGASG